MTLAAVSAPVPAVGAFFFRDLSLGDQGPDVLLLQKILNIDPSTQIATTGPGAPGEETFYFGPKTAAAVIKFQNKYAADILAPAGLSSGTGYVGSFTTNKLSKFAATAQVIDSFKKIPAPNYGTLPSGPTTASAPSVSYPSNYENLETYIAGVRLAGKKLGETPEQLDKVEAEIRRTAATTTNFREKFFGQLQVAQAKRAEALARAAQSDDLMTRFTAGIATAVNALLPKTAEAQMGLPFGGEIEYEYPCICTGGEIWSVGITPLPPSFPPVLDYAMGTQMYMNYTAPFALDFLGEYWPGVPSCWMGVEPACILDPSFGLMTPTLGTGYSI